MQIFKYKDMKKLIYLTGLLALSIVGCKKDFLDQKANVNSVQSDTYYNSVSEIDGATISQYAYIDNNDWWQEQWWRMVSGEAASDNSWIGINGGQVPAVQASHYTLNAGNNRIEAHWVETYKSIYGFNATIQGIEKSPVDQNTKNKNIAEIKFLRAFQYWDLVRNWGAVPLLTKPLSISDNAYTRTSADDVYKFIKQDLKDAITVLPKKSEYSVDNRFRASKGSAMALLAKIDLYTEDWAEAASMADAVINSGEYSLESSFGNVFATSNRNGKESIFEIQYQYSVQYPGLGNVFPLFAMAPSESGYGYFTPTSDLENAYKVQGDSVRLNWTIIRNGFPVAGDPAVPKFDGSPSKDKSARYGRKIYVPRSERTPGRFSKNHIYLRLADIYLIKAEASSAMLMQSTTALAALKVVRDRVGLTTDMTLTGWNLIDAVRKDKRLELAMEGDRVYDLRRWKDQSGQPVINSVMGPKGSFVKYNTQTSTDPYETKNLNEAQNKGAEFVAGVSNLWPIPSSEIIASEGRITQNPGY